VKIQITFTKFFCPFRPETFFCLNLLDCTLGSAIRKAEKQFSTHVLIVIPEVKSSSWGRICISGKPCNCFMIHHHHIVKRSINVIHQLSVLKNPCCNSASLINCPWNPELIIPFSVQLLALPLYLPVYFLLIFDLFPIHPQFVRSEINESPSFPSFFR